MRGRNLRITPRRNDQVNDSWMTDSGRSLYKSVKSDDRILQSQIDGAGDSLENTLNTASGLLKDKKVAVVGSCRSTLEELFYLSVLVLCKAKNFCEDILVRMMGFFNQLTELKFRGALVSGFEKEYPSDNLKKLNLALKKKQFEAVLVVGEDPMLGIDAENLMGVDLIHLATHSKQTSCLAKVVIPLLSL